MTPRGTVKLASVSRGERARRTFSHPRPHADQLSGLAAPPGQPVAAHLIKSGADY
jgi:hypothetical protein